MDTPTTEPATLWEDTAPYGEFSVGDIDGDGGLDIVATGSDELAIWWCEMESGKVVPIAGTSSPTIDLLNAVSLVDVTADGIDDVVFAQIDYGPDIDPVDLLVALGRTDGTPIPGDLVSAGTSGDWIVPIGDFDGDGRNDVTFGRHIYLGSSDPPYAVYDRTLEVVYEGFGWNYVTGIGDADSDGRDDILVSDWDVSQTFAGYSSMHGGAQLFFGGPPGAPVASWFVPATAAKEAAGASATLADLDQDGTQELVILSTTWQDNGSYVDGAVVLYDLSPSGPHLSAELRFTGERQETNASRLLNLGDDPNGTPRVAWVLEHEIRVLRRDGDALVVMSTIPAGVDREFGRSTVADVDADGRSDLVVLMYRYWSPPRIVSWPSTGAVAGGCIGGIDPDWVPNDLGTGPADSGTETTPSHEGDDAAVNATRSCGCSNTEPWVAVTHGWTFAILVGLRRRGVRSLQSFAQPAIVPYRRA